MIDSPLTNAAWRRWPEAGAFESARTLGLGATVVTVDQENVGSEGRGEGRGVSGERRDGIGWREDDRCWQGRRPLRTETDAVGEGGEGLDSEEWTGWEDERGHEGGTETERKGGGKEEEIAWPGLMVLSVEPGRYLHLRGEWDAFNSKLSSTGTNTTSPFQVQRIILPSPHPHPTQYTHTHTHARTHTHTHVSLLHPKISQWAPGENSLRCAHPSQTRIHLPG
jgi:hypothetical protein